jgi:predicted enzyme related to lactoylglutathione lyase
MSPDRAALANGRRVAAWARRLPKHEPNGCAQRYRNAEGNSTLDSTMPICGEHMKVTAVAYTAYPGEDVAKLLAFYKDALGLRVDRAHPDEEHAEFVEFDIGNNQWFTFLPEKFAGRKAGTGAGMVFEVDDIDAALAAVREKAKSADKEPTEFPNCRIATFTDPEGNTVGLHQFKAAAT